jgi:hypothetical protein
MITMYKGILPFILTISMVGCGVKEKGDNEIDTFPTSACAEPKLKQVYTMRGCNGDVCGYWHYVMLDEYSDKCFNDYGFVFVADKYLDSVKNDLPVKGIQFISPFEFRPVYDSQDLGPLDKNSILEITYSDSTMHLKIPEIHSLAIWVNGDRKTLDYMNFTSRERRMKYYHKK